MTLGMVTFLLQTTIPFSIRKHLQFVGTVNIQKISRKRQYSDIVEMFVELLQSLKDIELNVHVHDENYFKKKLTIFVHNKLHKMGY